MYGIWEGRRNLRSTLQGETGKIRQGFLFMLISEDVSADVIFGVMGDG